MTVAEIMKTMLAVGANLPAYKELLEVTLAAFGEHDQSKLREAYSAALTRADEAHTQAQNLG